jgi:hypothetical protein
MRTRLLNKHWRFWLFLAVYSAVAAVLTPDTLQKPIIALLSNLFALGVWYSWPSVKSAVQRILIRLKNSRQ